MFYCNRPEGWSSRNLFLFFRYVASTFNFFTGIASRLVSTLGFSDFSPSEMDVFYENQGVSKDSCSLSVISEEEICKLLDPLNVHKSTACD